MPSCTVGDSLCEFDYRQTKEDLEGMFGDDDLLGNVDLTNLDIDDVDLSVFETNYEDESDDDLLDPAKWVRVRGNHDCMLGGQCCNKESQKIPIPVPPPKATPAPASTPAPQPAPSVLITHSANKVVTIQKCISSGSDSSDVIVVTNNVRTAPVKVKAESRSLLLNRTTTVQPQQQPPPATTIPTASPAKVVVKREFPTPQSSRPETPLSLSESDDDYSPIPIHTPVDNSASIFRSALDVLNTSSSAAWEDDLLFGSAGRTKDEKPSGPSHNDLLRISASAKSDHNYDGSSKGFCLDGLGVDTPSDSEEDEEIDVVSLSERSSSRSSSCSGGGSVSGMPTRPTRRDREELEEITSSLLSASQAVSRKLKKTHKRKRYRSDSSEDDEEDSLTEYQNQGKRQRSSTSQRRKKHSRFGEEEDSQEKRDLHNNMERMRRIDLRNSFEELKALVPGVANKDRAPKVVILREAANYCCELGAESRSKYLQVIALKREQERLRRMVSSLRKAACVSRRH
uniref:BHLH domain-containing protein n=1 Tax=Graphocephala atropunctata TaxID=36148 RepID=A0A1B6L277_9HEMI